MNRTYFEYYEFDVKLHSFSLQPVLINVFDNRRKMKAKWRKKRMCRLKHKLRKLRARSK